MKIKLSKFIALLLVFAAFVSVLGGCALSNAQSEIVVLYTNDVHCAVDSEDGGIGYAALAAYKSRLEEKNPNVVLVDCGDALQGEAIGTLSEGEYIVDIMNEVGYDFAAVGNHEFDYGMERLSYLIDRSNAEYLSCNIRYTGAGESAMPEFAPYSIATYGNTDVAFIGVSTPESVTKSEPQYFMDDTGEVVYDFYGGSGEELYSRVQETVDQCREEGADYVIVLAHLGDDEGSEPFRSTDLIAGTNGIDAVLDGHSHSEISCDMIENKDGEPVPLSSTGTGFENIGRLTISPSGDISTGLIGSYPETDSEVDAYITDIQSRFESDLNRVVGRSETALSVSSPDGVRLVRSRETNIGDFCADAYRAAGDADIAIVNGGGIRADLPAGDITYGNILDVHPYGNMLTVVEATGQEILDALELGARSTMAETADGGEAIGESGGFLQVSGMRYTIDTSIESSVEVDENGMFVSCAGARRVKDVEVLQPDGSYAPLDPNATYTLASHNYLIREGGDGFNMFMDNNAVVEEGTVDYQILIDYINEDLGGVIGSDYADTQNRIIVE